MMWIHPAVGVLAVASMLWLGTQGMRSRHRKGYAAASRALHRRWSRRVAVLIGVAAVLGTASVAWTRPELAVAGSRHFWLGWTTAGFALVLAISGPRVPADPRARRVHPGVGLVALVLAFVTLAFGMSLLP